MAVGVSRTLLNVQHVQRIYEVLWQLEVYKVTVISRQFMTFLIWEVLNYTDCLSSFESFSQSLECFEERVYSL